MPKIYDYDITLYADDAVISVTEPNRMHEALLCISEWCILNSLTVNAKKTKWMLFNNIYNIDPVFRLNNVILERVYSFPYLGLTLDPELKFVQHRNITTKNVRYKVVQSSRAKRYVDEPAALTMYKTMVLPSIDCVDYIWDRGNVGENRELQYIQNKALRTVYGVRLEAHPKYNTAQLHELGKCKELSVRRDMHLLFYAFTLKDQEKLIDNRNIPTRQHQGIRFLVPRSLRPIVLRSAFYRAILRWNMLKAIYTEIQDIKSFKIQIKKNYNDCFI